MEEATQFKMWDSHTLDLCPDRIVALSPSDFLIAAYEHVPATKLTTGSLTKVRVGEKKLEVKEKSEMLEFGILSVKVEEMGLSLGCSDGQVRLVQWNEGSKLVNLCNFKSSSSSVCLVHHSNSALIAAGMQDGSVSLFDLASQELLHHLPKHHEFEVWSLHLTPDHLLYSGSDDCRVTCLDLRTRPELNKRFSILKNNAGVTFLEKHGDTSLLVGSHDGTLSLWDERNLKEAVSVLKFGDCSVWDVKWGNDFAVASCVYEGYAVWQGTPEVIGESKLKWYKGHGSICYAMEFALDKKMMLSTSFYDKNLQLVEIC